MNDKAPDADRVIAGWQETIREVEANKDGFVEIPRKRIVTTPTQAMNDKTLFPCPFCGGAPKSYWQGDSIDQDLGYWAIECCHIHVHTDDEAEAIAAWNTRAPQATRNEALEAALRIGVGCAYPVAQEVNERGYNWSVAYLDRWLPEARKALEGKSNG